MYCTEVNPFKRFLTILCKILVICRTILFSGALMRRKEGFMPLYSLLRPISLPLLIFLSTKVTGVLPYVFFVTRRKRGTQILVHWFYFLHPIIRTGRKR